MQGMETSRSDGRCGGSDLSVLLCDSNCSMTLCL
jgi:SapB morphogen precursor RamS